MTAAVRQFAESRFRTLAATRWGRLPVRFAKTCVLVAVLSQAVSADVKPPYLQVLPLFWSSLYPVGGETLYCGYQFQPFDRAVNVEHVLPMAWVARALRCGSRRQCQRNSRRFNQIESDMHNLYPALAEVNKRRAAMAYGILAGERHDPPGCDFEVDSRRRRVEPRAEVRGDIARAMLYMEKTWRIPLYPKQRALMLRWHRGDPSDDAEKRRNRLIRRMQGRRNTYID